MKDVRSIYLRNVSSDNEKCGDEDFWRSLLGYNTM